MRLLHPLLVQARKKLDTLNHLNKLLKRPVETRA